MGDVTFSGTALLVIGGLLTALTGAIGALFKLLLSAKDTLYASAIEERNSYREMASEAVSALEVIANRDRSARGDPNFSVILPAVPEHNSPATLKAINTAKLVTLRARLTAAKLDLKLPPRT